LFTISYDNNITEVETAYKFFWKKYAVRRMVLMSFAYGVFAGVFIYMIVRDYTGLAGWIGAGFALGLLVSIWLKPARAIKKIAAVFENSDEERYSATFYEDRIEVETVVVSDNSEISEKTDKTVIVISTEELYGAEKENMFILFVNRSLIYVFPKRCLSEEQTGKLREYFDKM